MKDVLILPTLRRPLAIHAGHLGTIGGTLYRYRAVKINGVKHDKHRVIANAIAAGFNIVVHHVDGDKLNNDPNNLELMQRTQHCKLHGFGTIIRPPSMQLFCPNENGMAFCRKCGKEKLWGNFLKDKNSAFGRRSMCKECGRLYKKLWNVRSGS